MGLADMVVGMGVGARLAKGDEEYGYIHSYTSNTHGGWLRLMQSCNHAVTALVSDQASERKRQLRDVDYDGCKYWTQ